MTCSPIPPKSPTGGGYSELLDLKDVPLILHLAPPEYISRYEFALKIAKRIGADDSLVQPVKVDDLNLPALRPKFAGLRSEMAAALLKRELRSVGNGQTIVA